MRQELRFSGGKPAIEKHPIDVCRSARCLHIAIGQPWLIVQFSEMCSMRMDFSFQSLFEDHLSFTAAVACTSLPQDLSRCGGRIEAPVLKLCKDLVRCEASWLAWKFVD